MINYEVQIQVSDTTMVKRDFPSAPKSKQNGTLKLQYKRSPLPYYRLSVNISMVQHHDLFAQAKAYSATAFFSAEERNKDFIKYFLGHSRAVIGYFD